MAATYWKMVAGNIAKGLGPKTNFWAFYSRALISSVIAQVRSWLTGFDPILFNSFKTLTGYQWGEMKTNQTITPI